MNDEQWTDDRLDRVIDAAAHRMTEGASRPGLPARVSGRLERRRPSFFLLAWQLVSATLVIALVVFAVVRLWPQPTTQRITAPTATPTQPPVVAAPSTAIASNASPLPPTIERRAHRRPPTIAIEERRDDIPALDAPAALSMDTAPVAQLRVSPLDVRELSVPPLETEPDGKPR